MQPFWFFVARRKGTSLGRKRTIFLAQIYTYSKHIKLKYLHFRKAYPKYISFFIYNVGTHFGRPEGLPSVVEKYGSNEVFTELEQSHHKLKN